MIYQAGLHRLLKESARQNDHFRPSFWPEPATKLAANDLVPGMGILYPGCCVDTKILEKKFFRLLLKMMRGDTIMKQIFRKGPLGYILLASILLVVTLTTWGNAFADGGDEPNPADYPDCSNMKAFQIAGKDPGSACQVPVVSKDGALSRAYRSGWTHRYTSESDSDLVEDQIKVDGYLYWWAGYWSLDDHCQDDNSWASHAACRTYGGGEENKQNGYHYFHKSGYEDTNFMTTDYW